MQKQLNLDSSGTPIRNTTFVVLDCETTGLSPSSNAITEIAAIKIHAGEKVGTFHSLVNPQQQLPHRISLLTGITNENLKDCPTIDEIIPSFLEFLGENIVVGHNVDFDLQFINASLSRCGYAILKNQKLDTLKLAKKIIPNEVRNYKLSTLANYCKSEFIPTHRAFSDVKATIEVFYYLLERSSFLGVSGINDLFTLPGLQKRTRFLKKQLAEDAPRQSGTYMFVSEDDQILYVGKSSNIRQRLNSYFLHDDRNKISNMLKNADRLEYIITPTPFEARVIELRLLQEFQPEFNVADITKQTMRYVVLDMNENVPTFRIKSKQTPDFGQKSICFGPFTSKTHAEKFREAIAYATGMRKCSNQCAEGKKTTTSACLNSLRGTHSCFCFDEWDSVDSYIQKCSDVALNFHDEFPKYSANIIAEMKQCSVKLQFEKAKTLLEHSFCLQKWMNRFITISSSSNFNSDEQTDLPAIVNGRPVVRFSTKQISESVEHALEIIKVENTDVQKNSFSVFKNENSFFIADASQFRERFYTATFLARNNFFKTELNANKQITLTKDHKKMRVKTIL